MKLKDDETWQRAAAAGRQHMLGLSGCEAARCRRTTNPASSVVREAALQLASGGLLRICNSSGPWHSHSLTRAMLASPCLNVKPDYTGFAHEVVKAVTMVIALFMFRILSHHHNAQVPTLKLAVL